MSTNTKNTEALRLADALEQGTYLLSIERDATAAELRRLDADNEQLKAALLTLHDTLEMTARAGAAHAKAAAKIEAAVKRLHAAKGRYHTQLAACNLFELCGLPAERPKK